MNKQEPSGHPTSASNVAWIIVNHSSTIVSWPLLALYDWGGADSPLPIFGKQCCCWGRTIKFCRHLCLPKKYPYTKFGCHNLIHDITMASLLFFSTTISGILHVYKSSIVACLCFYFIFWAAGMPSIIFSSENRQLCHKTVKFKKGVKLLKFHISWAMLMSAINLLNFNVLIDDQQYVFSPKNT